MYNKLVVLGNLTKDIELKTLPSGSYVGKSSIATSYKYKENEEVMFLEFSVFGKLAEVMNQYLKKGDRVFLEGRLKLDTWVAQDGTNRQKHSLIVNEMKMLNNKENVGSSKMEQTTNNYHNNQKQQGTLIENNSPSQRYQDQVFNSDDVPF